MTELAELRAEAAAARMAARGGMQGTFDTKHPIYADAARRDDVRFVSEIRGQTVEQDGREFYRVDGYASVFETQYEMWDEFGPYKEVVSKGAADATLAANPFVIFRWNHSGTAMANTTNGRLKLEADDVGLRNIALLNPARSDVQLLMHAIEDRDVSEQSFMFTIDDAEWSPDYTEFRIKQFDLDRGDVGPVQYGANPYTSIAARSGEILAAVGRLPHLAAREALSVLQARSDLMSEIVKAPVIDLTGDEPRSVEQAAAAVGEPVEPPRPQWKALPKREGRSVAMLRLMLLADDEL